MLDYGRITRKGERDFFCIIPSEWLVSIGFWFFLGFYIYIYQYLREYRYPLQSNFTFNAMFFYIKPILSALLHNIVWLSLHHVLVNKKKSRKPVMLVVCPVIPLRISPASISVTLIPCSL